MAELPRSSRYRATPDAPLSDEERNRLVDRLNVAYSSGAVDPDTYPRLLDQLFGARTLGEAAPVVAMLPGEPTHGVPAIVGQGTGRPGELAQPSQPRMSTVAVLGGIGAVALIIAVILIVGILIF